MATATAPQTAKDYKSEIPPDWCPGCGDFGVLNVLQSPLQAGPLVEQLAALSELQRDDLITEFT